MASRSSRCATRRSPTSAATGAFAPTPCSCGGIRRSRYRSSPSPGVAPHSDARDLHSALAAGPRFSLFWNVRDAEPRGGCDTNMDVAHGSELTYFDVGAFHADRRLPALPGGFVTVAGLDGVPSVAVPDATAVLVSRLRRFESLGTIRTESGVRPKGGFRWVEWEESFAMTAGTETFTTRTINSLYGYQWG